MLTRISTLSLQTQEARTCSAIVQSLIPFFPLFFFLLRSKQKRHLYSSPWELLLWTRNGWYILRISVCSRWLERHKPLDLGCTQGQPRSSCAPLLKTWKPGSLQGASVLNWSIKGTEGTSLERSSYNWRAVVNRGQALPLLFHSCLMF